MTAGCQPATRIGSTEAPGAIPLTPPGPPAPTRIPAISVPCRSSRFEPSGSRAALVSGSSPTRSIPGRTRPLRYGWRAVDAGVEQRDRHAAAVVAGQPQRRQAARPARDALAAEQGRGDGGRVGRPHRVDAGHLRPALEHRDRARVERRGEAVQDARVRELDPRPDPARAQLREQLPLGGEGDARPRPLLALARDAAVQRDPLRHRRRAQHDEHALADRDRRDGRRRRARATTTPPRRASAAWCH